MGLFACILNGKTTLLATGTIDCGLAVDDGHGLTVDFLAALDADDDGTGVDDAGRFTLHVLDRRVSFTMCFFCDADRPTHLCCTETVIDTLWTWISSSHANMCARGAKGPWDKRQKQKQHAHKQGVTHTATKLHNQHSAPTVADTANANPKLPTCNQWHVNW